MAGSLPQPQLERAYWLSTHREPLKKVAYGIGIVLCSIIWLNIGRYLISMMIDNNATQQAYSTIGDTTVLFNAQERARIITVKNSGSVVDGEAVDAYALVHNPNRLFGATFSYSVRVGGEEFVYNDGVIMPGQDSYIVAQGLIGATPGATLAFSFSDIRWFSQVGAPPRVEFSVTDPVLKPVEVRTAITTPDLTDKTGVSDLNSNTTNGNFVAPTTNTNTEQEDVPDTTVLAITNFTATVLNTSAYGFRIAQVIIVLQDEAGTVFGVKKITLRDFQSNANQPLQTYWSRRFPINVTPVVNVYTNYLSDDNLILPGQ